VVEELAELVELEPTEDLLELELVIEELLDNGTIDETELFELELTLDSELLELDDCDELTGNPIELLLDWDAINDELFELD